MLDKKSERTMKFLPLILFLSSLMADTMSINELIDKNINKSELEKIKIVNDYFNKIPYIDDIDNYNKIDYWANRNEFIKNGGDCEDFAIAKYYTLIDLGVDKRKLILKIVMIGKLYHMVVVYRDNNINYFLDNIDKTIRTKRNNIRLLYTIDDNLKDTSIMEKLSKEHWQMYNKRNKNL